MIAALVLLGMCLAAGAAVETARRSTIPLALDGQLVRREMRPEKHPGLDDVCLLHLADGRVLHVDAPVYFAVREGQHLRKNRRQRTLRHDDQEFRLVYSTDFHTQLAVALAAAVLLVGLGRFAIRIEPR